MLTVVVGVGAADRGEGLSSFAWRRVFSFFIFAIAFICNVGQVKGTFSREIICASPFCGGYEAWHCFEVQTKLMIVSLKTMTIFLMMAMDRWRIFVEVWGIVVDCGMEASPGSITVSLLEASPGRCRRRSWRLWRRTILSSLECRCSGTSGKYSITNIPNNFLTQDCEYMLCSWKRCHRRCWSTQYSKPLEVDVGWLKLTFTYNFNHCL